jgi:tetratricopeptide (TPR) repeat protein
LSCNRPTSQTKVRVRTDDKAADVQVDALGYDHAVASLDPASGKTDAAGVFDIFVRCVEGGPCPANTTVTFDAPGYTACTLEIVCTDHKAETVSDEDEKEAEAQQAFDQEEYRTAARTASEAADARMTRADTLARRIQADELAHRPHPEWYCHLCEDYFKAAQAYELARDAQLKLGDRKAANELQAKANEAYDKAAVACRRCGSVDFEAGRFDAADQAYGRAITALQKRGRDSSQEEKARRRIRLLIKKYLHSIGFGRPLTLEEERELHS